MKDDFEAWAVNQGAILDKDEDGLYTDAETALSWHTWQAAATETFVADVKTFMEAAGQTTEEFNVRQTALYLGLQLEEMAEKFEEIFGRESGLVVFMNNQASMFKDGYRDDLLKHANREALLDADIDLAWVTVGAALSSGADVLGAMQEVARSNLSKMVDGKMQKDSSGKVQKPESYSPPNLAPFIQGDL